MAYVFVLNGAQIGETCEIPFELNARRATPP
jgi:hypothetical protein